MKTPADSTLAGRVFKVEGSNLQIYVLLLCLNEINDLQLLPKTYTPQSTYCQKRFAGAFFVYHRTSTIPYEKNSDHLDSKLHDLLSKIIKAFQTKNSSHGCYMNLDYHLTPPHTHTLFKKHFHNFCLEPSTCILMIRNRTYTPSLVVPSKLRSKFLYQTHDCINHSAVTCMRVHLDSYWREFIHCDIELCMESC